MGVFKEGENVDDYYEQILPRAHGMPILVGYPRQSTEEKLLGLISYFSLANRVGVIVG